MKVETGQGEPTSISGIMPAPLASLEGQQAIMGAILLEGRYLRRLIARIAWWVMLWAFAVIIYVDLGPNWISGVLVVAGGLPALPVLATACENDGAKR